MNNRRDNMPEPSSSVNIDDALWSLVASAASGTLDEAARAQLDDRLRTDDAAVAFYVAYMRMHAQLAWARREENRDQEAEGGKRIVESGKLKAEEETTHHSPFTTHHSPPTPSHSPLRRCGRFVTQYKLGTSIAAGLLFVAAVLGWAAVTYLPSVAKQDAPHDEQRASKVEWVALLNHTHKAQWLDGTQPPANHPHLMPGQRLAIRAGLLEINYRTGAKVIVEGPAEFVIGGQESGARDQESDIQHSSLITHHSNSGYLALGKLTARCETAASKGFTITTPSGRVEDLGTEFGVEIISGGAARVEVFRGRVALLREDQIASEGFQLVQSEEATLLPSGQIVRAERLNHVDAKRRFVRHVPRTDAVELDEYGQLVLDDMPVGYWPLQISDDGVLHDATGLHDGTYHGVSPLDHAAESNRLHFGGSGNYGTVPYHLGLNTPSFSVELWVRIAPDHKGYGTLVTTRHEPTGQLFGYVLYAIDNRLALWTAKGNSREWTTLDGPTIERNRWTHVVATFQAGSANPQLGTARLYVDGQLAATNDSQRYAPNSIAPLVIGASPPLGVQSRYRFRGDLARVAIYERALGDRDINQHFETLNIVLNPEEP